MTSVCVGVGASACREVYRGSEVWKSSLVMSKLKSYVIFILPGAFMSCRFGFILTNVAWDMAFVYFFDWQPIEAMLHCLKPYVMYMSIDYVNSNMSFIWAVVFWSVHTNHYSTYASHAQLPQPIRLWDQSQRGKIPSYNTHTHTHTLWKYPFPAQNLVFKSLPDMIKRALNCYTQILSLRFISHMCSYFFCSEIIKTRSSRSCLSMYSRLLTRWEGKQCI